MMSTGRFKAGEDLRQRIQLPPMNASSAPQILFVACRMPTPPVKVAAAYEAVIGAQQKRLTSLLNAEAFAVRTKRIGQRGSRQAHSRAEADRKRLESESFGASRRFHEPKSPPTGPLRRSMRNGLIFKR